MTIERIAGVGSLDGFSAGDKIQMGPRSSWYVRLWCWLLRRDPPNVFRVTRAMRCSLDIEVSP